MARTPTEIQSELDVVRCAIKELVNGKRKVAVDLGGRVEQYGIVRLPELTEREAQLLKEFNAANETASPLGVVTA
jgi:hypothetical protein